MAAVGVGLHGRLHILGKDRGVQGLVLGVAGSDGGIWMFFCGWACREGMGRRRGKGKGRFIKILVKYRSVIRELAGAYDSCFLIHGKVESLRCK